MQESTEYDEHQVPVLGWDQVRSCQHLFFSRSTPFRLHCVPDLGAVPGDHAGRVRVCVPPWILCQPRAAPVLHPQRGRRPRHGPLRLRARLWEPIRQPARVLALSLFWFTREREREMEQGVFAFQ